MKNLLRLLGLICLTAYAVRAQETATYTTASVVPHSPQGLRSIQSYSDAQLAQLISALGATPLIWPTNSPNGSVAGTYWSLAHPSWPPLPTASGTPFWNLSPSTLAFSAGSSDASFFLLDDVDYPPSPGGGGTNVYNPNNNFQAYVPTTNDLWLQMISVSNTIASLVVHPPWNMADGVYDLYYTTNLAAPISWQWLLRTEAGQTNLAIANATDAQGFYDIRPPSDLAANDSLGTDFWLMFPSMVNSSFGNTVLSLNISSPVGATGTVTVLGYTNGPVLIVTNCGDTNVNGTYILTNMTAQEQTDWVNSGYDPTTTAYQKGTNWAGLRSGEADLLGYDAVAHFFTLLYYKAGENLNGTSNDWRQWADTNFPTPTTICPQAPLIVPFSVAAGAVTNIQIPLSEMTNAYDMIESNGIHVATDHPVSVYAMHYGQAVTAAFTAYPTPLLGTNYCLLSRAALDTYDSSPNSEFAIIATETNTTIWITPTATADLADEHTNAYSITLNQGQTYQINSTNITGDVTGTQVTSDKPIGVFAGANIAYVPDVNTQAGNPLVQEQLPVEQWGMQALAMPFAGRINGDTYRVLAANDNTTLSVTGKVVTIVNEYSFPWPVTVTNETIITNLTAGVPFDIIVDGPVEFQASQPIQVAQFANGTMFDGLSFGDPCEILLPPTGHYLMTNIVVTLPNDNVTGDFSENYLNVIVVQSGITNTMVDGSLVNSTNFVPIGTSGYYGTQITITASGTHTVNSSQPVGVEVYGFGIQDAYGYFGGVVK